MWLESLAESGEPIAWRWQTRVAAAEAVVAAVGSAQQHLPEQLLNKGTQRICALLSDEAYLARVQGARLVTLLLQTSSQMQVSWTITKSQQHYCSMTYLPLLLLLRCTCVH